MSKFKAKGILWKFINDKKRRNFYEASGSEKKFIKIKKKSDWVKKMSLKLYKLCTKICKKCHKEDEER